MGSVLAASAPMADPPSCPRVIPIGDSITYGVAAQTLAGWREPIYFLGQAAVGAVRFVGTQTFAGNGDGLAANPQHEGRPGWVVSDVDTGSFNSLMQAPTAAITSQQPHIAILAGGTNDIATALLNATAAATAAKISEWLDAVWALRTYPRFQIVLCTVLKRLDADDAKVVALNALLPGIVAGKAYAASVTLATMYDAIQDPTIGTGGYNDAVHPNDEGFTDMATHLWPYLQTAIVAAR